MPRILKKDEKKYLVQKKYKTQKMQDFMFKCSELASNLNKIII